jgi:hypothetical protein
MFSSRSNKVQETPSFSNESVAIVQRPLLLVTLKLALRLVDFLLNSTATLSNKKDDMELNVLNTLCRLSLLYKEVIEAQKTTLLEQLFGLFQEQDDALIELLLSLFNLYIKLNIITQ